jgi:hypothetical protein
MSEIRQTYMQLALQGYREPDEIDDFVSEWHRAGTGLSLHEYLGLTHDEYTLWVADPDLIDTIVGARISGRPLFDAVNDNLREDRLAARADQTRKLKILRGWIDAQRQAHPH